MNYVLIVRIEFLIGPTKKMLQVDDGGGGGVGGAEGGITKGSENMSPTTPDDDDKVVQVEKLVGKRGDRATSGHTPVLLLLLFLLTQKRNQQRQMEVEKQQPAGVSTSTYHSLQLNSYKHNKCSTFPTSTFDILVDTCNVIQSLSPLELILLKLCLKRSDLRKLDCQFSFVLFSGYKMCTID